MSGWSDLAERVRALVFRGRQDRELEEEMRFHLEREAEERIRLGLSPDAARREALVAFGGVARFKDEVRDARGVSLLEEAVADARYALRALAHHPGFTASVIVVLGLGIGASTAVFGVVDSVLLSDLPYPDADRIVRVMQESPTNRMYQLSTVDWQAVRDQNQVFTAFGVARPGGAAVSGAGEPQRVQSAKASAGFFAAVGIPAAYGRLVEAADEAMGAPPVVVVTFAFAERVLGGAASAVGKSLTIDGVSHAVIGVLPRGRPDLAGISAELWPALRVAAPARRGPFWLRAYGRLKPGVTREAAARDLAGISERIYPIWAAGFQDKAVKFMSVTLRESVIGTADRQVGLFAGGVILVLLVAIANVATLVLVRASAREHELSVRAALGATRGRIARLMITECIALTLLAGLAGLGIAALSLRLVADVAPNLPRLAEVGLGARAAAFAVMTALVSGLLVSISPVWGVLRGGQSAALRADARRAGTSRRTNLVRGALVTAEFALALPLLLGAGLLLNSFLRLQRVELGFNPDGAVSVNIALPSARYSNPADVQAFWRNLEARARDIPGVTALGFSSSMPPNNGGDVNNFDLLDHPTPAGESQPVVPWNIITPGFFDAMGIRMVDGRLFSAADSATAPPVVVVSRAWARHYYPRENALGKRMISGGCTTCAPTTVVGIVADVKFLGLQGDGEAAYAPVSQDNPTGMALVARTPRSAAETYRALRGAISAVDPELAVSEITLAERVDQSLADPRRWTAMIGAFAGAALLLAALGIFGLMSYIVRQRRRELGVRLALGAEPGALTWMVVSRGMRYAIIGTVAGLGLSLVESRWLGSLLFGVGAMDPSTLVPVALILLFVGLLACWIPGIRAGRIAPVEVLSSE